MRALLVLVGLSLSACLSPPATSERATDAARDLNIAARFGRLEVARTLTSDAARKGFVDRRAQWGKEIRVMDVELAGFSMTDGEKALVEVDYSWSRENESLLRTTRVSQEYRDPGGGFRLVREKRLSGDLGLFGEPSEREPARPDVQFATKTIQ